MNETQKPYYYDTRKSARGGRMLRRREERGVVADVYEDFDAILSKLNDSPRTVIHDEALAISEGKRADEAESKVAEGQKECEVLKTRLAREKHVTFWLQRDLDEYQAKLAEAEKRDERRLKDIACFQERIRGYEQAGKERANEEAKAIQREVEYDNGMRQRPCCAKAEKRIAELRDKLTELGDCTECTKPNCIECENA